MSIITQLKLTEISDMEPLDLGLQIRSIIEKDNDNLRRIVDHLASYFSISRKGFRKAILDAQQEVSHKLYHNGYIFAFYLENENKVANTFGCEITDYGVEIPLIGENKTRSVVSVPVTFFVNHGKQIYEKRVKKIPAFNLEDKLIMIEQI